MYCLIWELKKNQFFKKKNIEMASRVNIHYEIAKCKFSIESFYSIQDQNFPNI